MGYSLVVGAALVFALNAALSRVPITAGMDVNHFTSMRITGAFVVFALLAAAFDREALRLPRRDQLIAMAALGIVGVVGLQWTYNISITRLPIGIALLIEYTAPILIVLWVRFIRGEQVHGRVWPAIGLALLGLAIVGQVWEGLVFDQLGLVMACAAAMCFASYFLIGERLTSPRLRTDRKPVSALHVTVWSFGSGSVVINLINPFWHAEGLGESAAMLGRFSHISIPVWVSMILVVVLGTVTPYFVYLFAMKFIPSTNASVVAMVEPLFALMIGWIWYYEALSAGQLVGVALVLTGIIAAQTARIPQVPEPADPQRPVKLDLWNEPPPPG